MNSFQKNPKKLVVYLGVRVCWLVSMGLGLACAPQEGSQVSPQNSTHAQEQIYREPLSDAEEADHFYETASVSCPNPEKCHPSVGLVVLRLIPDDQTHVPLQNRSDGVAQCTGFLLGSENRLITNSHCIPETLAQDLSADCSTRLKVLFPKIGDREADEIRCKKIEVVTDRPFSSANNNVDFAIIELERKAKDRTALKANNFGVSDAKPLTIYKVNPTGSRLKGRLSGELTQGDCQSVQKSLASPLYTHDQAALLSFSDHDLTKGNCLIIGGNSGSPLLDKNGEVVAIVNSAYNLDRLELIKKNITLANLSAGTAIRCLEDRNHCHLYQTQDRINLNVYSVDVQNQIIETTQKLGKEWAGVSSIDILWKSFSYWRLDLEEETVFMELRTFLYADCIESNAPEAANYVVHTGMPNWSTRVAVDALLRPFEKPKTWKQIATDHQTPSIVGLRKLSGTNNLYKVQIMGSNGSDFVVTNAAYAISKCTPKSKMPAFGDLIPMIPVPTYSDSSRLPHL